MEEDYLISTVESLYIDKHIHMYKCVGKYMLSYMSIYTHQLKVLGLTPFYAE